MLFYLKCKHDNLLSLYLFINQISTLGINLNLELGEFTLEYFTSCDVYKNYELFWRLARFFLKSVLDLLP